MVDGAEPAGLGVVQHLGPDRLRLADDDRVDVAEGALGVVGDVRPAGDDALSAGPEQPGQAESFGREAAEE